MKLSNAEKAFIDSEKLSRYCLNPAHERGKHKARLFSSVPGLTLRNVEEMKTKFLEAV